MMDFVLSCAYQLIKNLKRTLFQVSIKNFTFISRVEIKILEVFRISLDDCFWVWPLSEAYLELKWTSMIKLIYKNSEGLETINYFLKKFRDVQLGSKYTSDSQTFEKKTQQKFTSCQNKLLAN